MTDPATRLRRDVARLQRDWAIADARAAGVPVKDIAAQHGLTPMRVYQLTQNRTQDQ